MNTVSVQHAKCQTPPQMRNNSYIALRYQPESAQEHHQILLGWQSDDNFSTIWHWKNNIMCYTRLTIIQLQDGIT